MKYKCENPHGHSKKSASVRSKGQRILATAGFRPIVAMSPLWPGKDGIILNGSLDDRGVLVSAIVGRLSPEALTDFPFAKIIAGKYTISAHLLQCCENAISFITEKKIQLGRVLALSS